MFKKMLPFVFFAFIIAITMLACGGGGCGDTVECDANGTPIPSPTAMPARSFGDMLGDVLDGDNPQNILSGGPTPTSMP